MSLETGLRDRLLANPAVVALVGAEVYPHDAPEYATFPYITYHMVSDEKPRNVNAGTVRYKRYTYEIGVFGVVYDDVEALADVVWAAFGGDGNLETTLDGVAVILSWDDSPTHKARFEGPDFSRDYILFDLDIKVKG